MKHLGIDLGAGKSSVCVLGEGGNLVERKDVPTSELAGFFRRYKGARAVMESCTQSRKVAELARAAGLEAIVVPATFVRQLGVGARGIKTDAKDAEQLARASLRNVDLPQVRPVCERSRGHRRLLQLRQKLVQMRTKCIASIKSYLRGELIVLKGRATPAVFCETVEQLLLKRPDGVPMDVQIASETLLQLDRQVAKLDASVAEIVRDDQVCQRLMTVPGVGPVVSLAFACHVDDISQFPTAEHLASYLALVPGENTTGGRIKRTGVIKAGPTMIRALLVQAAWSMWRTQSDSQIVQWAKQVAERRGKKTAITALARKLAAVMFAMWKKERNYHPFLPSPRPPPTAELATSTAAP